MLCDGRVGEAERPAPVRKGGCWQANPLVMGVLIIPTLPACGSELGVCDTEAAQALVFDDRNRVATAGQALAHDGCGSGAFCHSAGAEREHRKGVPKGLDFDMLPTPRGWKTLWKERERAWEAVQDRSMPPQGETASLVRDSGWSFSYQRDDASERLPPITSKRGREIFRNWLACGAPTVKHTTLGIPDAGAEDRPNTGSPEGAGDSPDWGPIYADLIEPSCVTGCHTEGGQYAQLDLSELCRARTELAAAAPCGEVRVVPGDRNSLLVRILGAEQPDCNGARRMPLVPPYLSLADQQRVAAWVEAGAEAETCE